MNYAERNILNSTINLAAAFPCLYFTSIFLTSLIAPLQLKAHYLQKLAEMDPSTSLTLKEVYTNFAVYNFFEVALIFIAMSAGMILFFIAQMFFNTDNVHCPSLAQQRIILKAKIFAVLLTSLISVFNGASVFLNLMVEENRKIAVGYPAQFYQAILQYMNAEIVYWWGYVGLISGIAIPISLLVFCLDRKYDTK